MTAPHRIDIHHHILPPEWCADAAVRRFAAAQYMDFTKVPWSAASATAHLDALGVRMAVASIAVPGVWFGNADRAAELARTWNAAAAELCRAHPDRWRYFATVPLPDPAAAVQEVRRVLDVPPGRAPDVARSSNPCVGIGAFTSYENMWLGDPSLEPFYEELDRRAAVVFIHPTTPAACRCLLPHIPEFLVEVPTDTTRAVINLLLTGTLRRHPHIRWIVCHGGGTLPLVAGRLEALLDQSPELAARIGADPLGQLRRLYYDLAAATSASSFAALRGLVPPSQMLFGTDSPFLPAERLLREFLALDLSDADRHGVEQGNAASLLAFGPPANTGGSR